MPSETQQNARIAHPFPIISRTTGIVVLSLAILLFAIPRYVAADSSCGLYTNSFTAHGYFFDSYERTEYSPEGYLIEHMRLLPQWADGRQFSINWVFLDEECVAGGAPSFFLNQLSLPPGVTDWSIRFTSLSHFDVWDDQHSAIVARYDIPQYPPYFRIILEGMIDGYANLFQTGLLQIRNDGTGPPLSENKIEKPASCQAGSASGYLFDAYQSAEYVNGLLRVHLRIRGFWYDGRGFYAQAVGMRDDCSFVIPTQYGTPFLNIPPYIRYYSFRMSSPTHWMLWDDDNDRQIQCLNCQGDVPLGSAYVSYNANTGSGASILTTTPFPPTNTACTIDCFSNVLFLPGIESSRLYRPDYNGGTDKLWEPLSNSDVRDLFLKHDGTSVRGDIYAKEGDVLDEIAVPMLGTNVYKSFIAKMNDLKGQHLINDWEAAPYDWRLSIDDILRNGADVGGRLYYSGDLAATSTPYIIQELRRLAATSKSGKVTIIAHSNGGLVAKRLTELLGADASKLTDRMIFVAVPQAGTPMTIPAGLHGYEQDHLAGLITSKATARTFASTSPITYQLLPSANYFTYVDDPVVTFDQSLPDWTLRYGTIIHSRDRLHQFLTDSYGRVDAQTGDIDQPIQFSDSLLSNAEALHSDLDNWTPPAGVELIQIAGWGVPKTVTGINYKKKGSGVQPDMNFTIDGDGTVVVPSALWTSTTTARSYWMNLRSYNAGHPLQIALNFDIFDHARILEADPILTFISDTVMNTTKSLSEYTYLSSSSPPSTNNRLRFTLHSPLSLNMYDSLGNHTGISTTTNQVEEQIPGTYFTQFGDIKYLFSDSTSTLHILMSGYATSTFTFDVAELQGDALIATTTWKDMPTTPTTKVTIDTQSSLPSLTQLHIDLNGDGIPEYNLAPRQNGIVTLPPYIWSGFSQPINDTAYQTGQSLSVFKAGSTVPVKFQLKKPNGTITQASTTPLFSYEKGSAMTAPIDESTYSTSATSGNTYRWDSTEQQYIYNWSTKGLAAGYWYKVYAQLDDGAPHFVVVGLR